MILRSSGSSFRRQGSRSQLSHSYSYLEWMKDRTHNRIKSRETAIQPISKSLLRWRLFLVDFPRSSCLGCSGIYHQHIENKSPRTSKKKTGSARSHCSRLNQEARHSKQESKRQAESRGIFRSVDRPPALRSIGRIRSSCPSAPVRLGGFFRITQDRCVTWDENFAPQARKQAVLRRWE